MLNVIDAFRNPDYREVLIETKISLINIRCAVRYVGYIFEKIIVIDPDTFSDNLIAKGVITYEKAVVYMRCLDI